MQPESKERLENLIYCMSKDFTHLMGRLHDLINREERLEFERAFSLKEIVVPLEFKKGEEISDKL